MNANSEIYSKADVKRILAELYEEFEGMCSDGADCLYAEFLRAIIKRLERQL